MTFLRKRFTEDLQLHGYSQRTVDAQVRAVRQLAEHYHKSPDKITEEELRHWNSLCKIQNSVTISPIITEIYQNIRYEDNVYD